MIQDDVLCKHFIGIINLKSMRIIETFVHDRNILFTCFNLAPLFDMISQINVLLYLFSDYLRKAEQLD